jgi:hypothetical protein
VKEIGVGLMGLVRAIIKITAALQKNCRTKSALIFNL